MAPVQHLRGDLPDGLAGAQNRHPDRVRAVHGLHQVVKHHTVRRIRIHTDLLVDDAPFLLHTLFRKIGGRDEFQQQMKTLLKMLRTRKIVGGHIIAGKGVGHSTQGGKFRRDFPVSR